MSQLKLSLFAGVILLAIVIWTPHEVVACSVALSQLTVTQGTTFTSFNITLYGMPHTGYTLSVSGVPGMFSPSSSLITHDNGYGYAEFSVDFGVQLYAWNFGPPYPPGDYPFTITAQSTSDSCTGRTDVDVKPSPLPVAVFTDKSAYTEGDMVTLRIWLERAAQGTIAVTSPSGQTQYYTFFSTAATPTILSRSIQATSPFGTWTVTVEANDYTGETSTTSTHFNVNPIMYIVNAYLGGVPANESAGIQVDGNNQVALGAQPYSLSFPDNTNHTISVDPYVAGSSGIRYHCSQNKWTFDSAGKHTFNYQTQYALVVSSDPPDVFPTVTEWYDPGVLAGVANPVPQTVQGQTFGTKYVFDYWDVDGVRWNGNLSFVMNRQHEAVAKYTVQYLLTVLSPDNLGDPQGTGYYDAGTVANFSVTSPQGFLVQRVFSQWSGNLIATPSQSSVVMNKPITVSAVWTTNFLQPALLSLLIIVGLSIPLLNRKRTKMSTSTDQQMNPKASTPSIEAFPQPDQTRSITTNPEKLAESRNVRRCRHCGDEVPLERIICPKCQEPA